MKYRIKATDAQGRDQSFVLDAADEHAAAVAIRKRGFFPFEVKLLPDGPTPLPSEFLRLLIFMARKTKAHPLFVGSTATILVVFFTLLIATSDSRCYRRAAKAYRAGYFKDAIAITSELSPRYRSKATVTYLKSDSYLQLAQGRLEHGRLEEGLAYLQQISTRFQKYEMVVELIKTTSQTIVRQEEERRRDANRRRIADRRREAEEYRANYTSSTASRSQRYSKPHKAFLDDAEDRARNPVMYESVDILMDAAAKNYDSLSHEDKAMYKGMKLLDRYSAKELNSMSDAELIHLIQE